jgi:hypothetical protein
MDIQPDNQGTYLLWEYSEADRYDRSGTWYFVMGSVALGLLLYSLASGNFLFALIVVMATLVVYLSSTHPKEESVVVAVTEEGINVGGAFYAYGEISHFWLIYEPPAVKSLYLDFKEPWKPRVVLDLDEQNPNEVREVLGAYIVEDLTKDEEPLVDVIGRALKL